MVNGFVSRRVGNPKVGAKSLPIRKFIQKEPDYCTNNTVFTRADLEVLRAIGKFHRQFLAKFATKNLICFTGNFSTPNVAIS